MDRDQPRGSVQLTDSYQTLDDLFSCQDLSGILNYGALKKAQFHPNGFNIPGIKQPDTTPPFPSPEPVFRARLTLMEGGVLLSVGVHHCTTDITGFGVLLKIWAAYCRRGSSDEVGFDRCWQDRGALLGPFQAPVDQVQGVMPDLLHLREPSALSQSSNATASVLESKTCIFYFSQKVLMGLKESANIHVASLGTGVDWISKSDALTAILWSAVIWAEQDTHANEVSTIGFPVNIRSRLHPPLPKNYLGTAFGMTSASIPRRDLISLSQSPSSPVRGSAVLDVESAATLAKIGATVRKSIGLVDEMGMRHVMAYTASQPDIRPIKLGPRHDGVSIVSWADAGTYELDWGTVLGRCEAVRLGKLTARRYPIILPRLPNGGLDVIVSLDGEAMKRFCHSRMISMFGTVKCSM